MAAQAMLDQRHFKRLVRNMRRAGELFGRLVGARIINRGGHVYRLVPAKAFDEVLDTLKRLSGGQCTPQATPRGNAETKETKE